MGGFQATAAGLGQTGEDIGKGYNDALNEALKVQLQSHNISMDQSNLALRQAAQQQSYSIAQQAHELTRQQIIQSGWKDMGVALDPQSGQYTRTFYNEQTGERRPVPVSGVPPDSPQGLLAYYKNLAGMQGEDGKAMFTPLQAKQIAFKMPQLYREGPAGMMEGFRDYAVDNLGMSPEKAQKFAQTNFDIVYGRGGYFHYGAGGKPVDQTGWTANEQREYKAAADQAAVLERLYGHAMDAQIQGNLDPTQNQTIINNWTEKIMEQYERANQKAAEISGRHGRTGEGGSPQKNAYKIGNTWYDAITKQPIPATGQ